VAPLQHKDAFLEPEEEEGEAEKNAEILPGMSTCKPIS